MITEAVDAEVNRHTHHLDLLSAQKEPRCSPLGSVFTNKALIFIPAASTIAQVYITIVFEKLLTLFHDKIQ